ncbi:MAG: OmpA family protein [Pseudomonadota bacterium]|nr:OmpA family protein [Pseudomonadota bacterium]
MKHSKTVLAAALGLLVASTMPALAGEKTVNNYVRDSNGVLVRDSEGNCVRSSDKTTILLEECGYPGEEVVVKKEPEAAEVAIVEQGTVLAHVVIDNIQFEFDSAVLTANDKVILDNAYEGLGPWKELLQKELSHIEITGYTDTSGPEAYNQALSERRANSVADYMAAKGTDRGRMVVKGMGEANPVADNSTRAGRIKNRRVELDVIKD